MKNNLVELLRECRQEFAEINGLKAFGAYCDGSGFVEVLDNDIRDLDYTDLIFRIEEVLKYEI